MEESKILIAALKERLEKHDDNRRTVQESLHEICNGLRREIDKIEEKINSKLEEEFMKEDNRLQSILNSLHSSTPEDISKAIQKARAELLIAQSYELTDHTSGVKIDIIKNLELNTKRFFVSEAMEIRRPRDVQVTEINGGVVSLVFAHLSPDESKILFDNNLESSIEYVCALSEKVIRGQANTNYSLKKTNECFSFVPDHLEQGVRYGIRAKMVLGDRESDWSNEVEFTPEFRECLGWKKCPDSVISFRKYFLDENNPRLATKNGFDDWSTVVGNKHLPPNKVISWEVKVRSSRKNNGSGIYVGVAPCDIDQNDANYKKSGWYFDCFSSSLYSGPPHMYNWRQYGKEKRNDKHVQTGDSVRVVMDMTKGNLSFILGGVNLGIAYEGIPFDKPLVPCVILRYGGDSVELVI